MGVYLFTPEDLIRYGSARPEQLEVLREAVLGKKDILIVGSSRSGKTKLVEALMHYIPDDWKVAVVTAYGEFKPFKPNIIVIDTQFDQRPLERRTDEVIEKLKAINPVYIVIDTLHTVDSARIFRELIDDYRYVARAQRGHKVRGEALAPHRRRDLQQVRHRGLSQEGLQNWEEGHRPDLQGERRRAD